eukprot:NODE_38683_length_241_cov_1.035088.p1 GENE.NODE_38683_length_241_cov_1.035088~~NODE_38683_length_241_cov_1.035088.p1  ORF type:complete len:57 (-),score=18.12 NODE_38683_length_241_cov_1.035088:7-177(-)
MSAHLLPKKKKKKKKKKNLRRKPSIINIKNDPQKKSRKITIYTKKQKKIKELNTTK